MDDMEIADWHTDLDALAEILTRHHRDPFHAVSREEFRAAVARLHEQLPDLHGTARLVAFDAVVAMIGDGHTRIETDHCYRRFPLELFWYGDQLCVVRALVDDPRVHGARLVAIGGVDIECIGQRVRAQIPQGENEWYVREHSAERLTRADVLVAVGCLDDTKVGEFTFADQEGSDFTTTLSSLPPGEAPTWPTPPPDAPIRWQNPGDPLTYTALPNAAYANFRSYQDLDRTGPALIARLHEDAPSKLILDLRDNDGGNYTIAREQLIYPIWSMPTINRPGGLYVLIGRRTFSASMVTATDFRRETEAVLVGEPTGARPVGYQELGTSELPRSGLRVHFAIRRYRFADTDLPAVFPDQLVEPDWHLERAGNDPALEWCLAQPY